MAAAVEGETLAPVARDNVAEMGRGALQNSGSLGTGEEWQRGVNIDNQRPVCKGVFSSTCRKTPRMF